MKKVLIFGFIFLSTLSSAQFRYSKVPVDYVKTVDNDSSYLESLSQAFDLTKALPIGFVKDGSIDYTEYIQSTLNKYKVVKLPDFPLAVNSKGLSMSSNSILIFKGNAELRMIPNDKNGYSLLQIINKNNVKIYNPKLTGDRYKHLGSKGEWGMGISISNSSNINISNSNISDFWGDGIYVGGNKYSSNVKISGGLINNNRRNGITVVSGDNIEISNVVVANSNGANPMTGIDIEPNSDTNEKININIFSVITYNNNLSGFAMNLNGLKSKTVNNRLNIMLKNTRDIKSRYGISYGNVESSSKKKLEGKILLENISLSQNSVPFRFIYSTSSLDNIALNINKLNISHKDELKYMNSIKQFQEKKIHKN